MTKAELIKRVTVAAEGRLTRKEAERFADAVFEHLAEAITAEGRFTWPTFGTWSVRTRRERRAHNPRTGLAMQVPAGRTVGFRTSPALEDAVQAAAGPSETEKRRR